MAPHQLVGVRVVSRVRGKPTDNPLHLQHPEHTGAISSTRMLRVRRITGWVPAQSHEHHGYRKVLVIYGHQATGLDDIF